MKISMLALAALFIGSNANAFLGFPPREEMNVKTIQLVKQNLAARGLTRGRVEVETLRLNNRYLVSSAQGCLIADVQWDDFGWPNVDGVAVRAVDCQ